MAELATIARPYAEALFRTGGSADVSAQLEAAAAVASDAQLRRYASNPKVGAAQVFDVLTSVVSTRPGPAVANLLRAVIDNGRLAALPEIAAQFKALVNAKSGVSDATVYSAFDIDAAQLPDVVGALERRFGRKLNAIVVRDESLIGGIRAVVGDEVLDTSVKARLEQMKVALTA
ncbi:F0F1 ATP synthase subunit delta [Methylibium sp.]|uniref:F0F1 ATP synthase subunit delta n=1 Tax=Methylibium sp. TaxID=2067992 RepID=UPI00286D2353|nr:F0F1 ATP synthase subunit delta [Methylibium sp.]